jgi:hypothetical protein
VCVSLPVAEVIIWSDIIRLRIAGVKIAFATPPHAVNRAELARGLLQEQEPVVLPYSESMVERE